MVNRYIPFIALVCSHYELKKTATNNAQNVHVAIGVIAK